MPRLFRGKPRPNTPIEPGPIAQFEARVDAAEARLWNRREAERELVAFIEGDTYTFQPYTRKEPLP